MTGWKTSASARQGQVAQIHHALDPEMSARNRRQVSTATAEFNRVMGRIRRSTRPFAVKHWYAVDREARIILGSKVGRSRADVARQLGLLAGPQKNGCRVAAALEGTRFDIVRGRSLVEHQRYAAFRPSTEEPI